MYEVVLRLSYIHTHNISYHNIYYLSYHVIIPGTIQREGAVEGSAKYGSSFSIHRIWGQYSIRHEVG